MLKTGGLARVSHRQRGREEYPRQRVALQSTQMVGDRMAGSSCLSRVSEGGFGQGSWQVAGAGWGGCQVATNGNSVFIPEMLRECISRFKAEEGHNEISILESSRGCRVEGRLQEDKNKGPQAQTLTADIFKAAGWLWEEGPLISWDSV